MTLWGLACLWGLVGPPNRCDCDGEFTTVIAGKPAPTGFAALVTLGMQRIFSR